MFVGVIHPIGLKPIYYIIMARHCYKLLVCFARGFSYSYTGCFCDFSIDDTRKLVKAKRRFSTKQAISKLHAHLLSIAQNIVWFQP